MSLRRNHKLIEIAKARCRELRKNQTKAESILWERVRRKQLNGLKFYRQYAIFYDILGEETFYIADFYCHEKKLVVEVDGDIHKFQKNEDALREDVLSNLGLRVVRFSNDEVENEIEKVINKLKLFLEN